MRNQLLLFFFLSVTTTNIFAANGIQKIILNVNRVSSDVSDATEIYFAQGTSQLFSTPQDSKKIFDTISAQIYSLTSDMVACYSNGCGNLVGSSVVTIGIETGQAGTYLISASTISNFDEGSIILLEDRMLGTFTDLRQYTDTALITDAGQNQTRFYLHVSAPPVLSAIAAGCTNENGKMIVSEDSAVRWTAVLLFDSNSRLVASLNDTTGGFSFGGLTSGNYAMAFTSGSYTFVKTLIVTSNEVLLTISAAATKAEVGQTMLFYSTANDATDYTWTFGDSSIITGIANPGYNYYQPGTYTVSLRASNSFNCSANASITIDISAETATGIADVSGDSVQVYSYNNTVVIAGNNLTGIAYVCDIYNLAGQLITTTQVTSSYFTLNLDGQSAGIYLVQVKTATGTFTKKVFVGRS